MTNAQNIIALMTALVAQMTPLVTIDTNVVDNGNWKLEMCNTYWLSVGHTITIGGSVFTVVSFIQNDHIVVSGAAQPVGATFLLNAPEFKHGSHRKVDNERVKQPDASAPWVYLPTPKVREDNRVDTDLAYTAEIAPLFLMEYDKDEDEIDLQQTAIIDPLNAMADFFIKLINADLANFYEPDFIERQEWPNFGNKTIWGNDELIFDQDLSGVDLKMSLEVLPNDLCICNDEPIITCSPVTMTFNLVPITSTGSGGTMTITVKNDAAIPIPVGVVDVDNAGNLEITVPAAGSSSAIYNILVNGVDTGQDLDFDGSNHTINLG